MKKIWKILLLIAGLLIILTTMVSCGGGGGGSGYGTATASLQPVACPASNTTNVAIPRLAFSPATITVPANGIVKWTNNDTVVHTVTSTSAPSNNSFNSTVNPGTSVCYQFTAAGTYSYYCAIHPIMTGSVTVTAAGGVAGF